MIPSYKKQHYIAWNGENDGLTNLQPFISECYKYIRNFGKLHVEKNENYHSRLEQIRSKTGEGTVSGCDHFQNIWFKLRDWTFYEIQINTQKLNKLCTKHINNWTQIAQTHLFLHVKYRKTTTTEKENKQTWQNQQNSCIMFDQKILKSTIASSQFGQSLYCPHLLT